MCVYISVSRDVSFKDQTGSDEIVRLVDRLTATLRRVYIHVRDVLDNCDCLHVAKSRARTR